MKCGAAGICSLYSVPIVKGTSSLYREQIPYIGSFFWISEK